MSKEFKGGRRTVCGSFHLGVVDANRSDENLNLKGNLKGSNEHEQRTMGSQDSP
jgi:hypothetical protein